MANRPSSSGRGGGGRPPRAPRDGDWRPPREERIAKSDARKAAPRPQRDVVSPARRVAYDVLWRVFEQGAYADRALRAAAGELDQRERSLAKQLVFGTVQRKGSLDWQVVRLAGAGLEPQLRYALWLGLYQMLYLETADHAAITQSVELAKPSPGHRLVNAVLRRVQRDGAPELPDDLHPAGAAVRHSHPEWLVRLWWRRYGADETRALLAADNEPAEFALRLNTLVELEEALLPDGRRDGDAFGVEGPGEAASSPLWASGAILVQSRAAQSVARAVDPQPGERILDLCAAPGGKTTHLSALMGDEGQVVAVERNAGRARTLQRTAERLRATNVEVVQAEAQDFDGEHGFDRVLVDPPCSGLGTLRSHPDLRWRMTPEAIEGLVVEQDAILEAARRALKPGGRLVYSTCTISEREERVAGGTQTFPHRDGTDGFYVATTD